MESVLGMWDSVIVQNQNVLCARIRKGCRGMSLRPPLSDSAAVSASAWLSTTLSLCPLFIFLSLPLPVSPSFPPHSPTHIVDPPARTMCAKRSFRRSKSALKIESDKHSCTPLYSSPMMDGLKRISGARNLSAETLISLLDQGRRGGRWGGGEGGEERGGGVSFL